jgi:hypothetical protein
VAVRLRSQVLFAEAGRGHLRLDGALLEPSATLPAGSPVTFVLKLPESGVVAAVVESTLHRWADAIDAIELELHPRRAVLSDGVSTVRLEVESGSVAA